MNADRLLEHFERISDAADAVPRLRRFVLDLAVRGKLVAQDATNETADSILELVGDLGPTRQARGRKASVDSDSTGMNDHRPHALPSTWKWVTLGDLFNYDAGIKREPRQLDPELWLLELEDIEKDTSRIITRLKVRERDSQSTKSEFLPGDILYGKLRPYLNKVVVADQPGYSTTEIVAIRPKVLMNAEYCRVALQRPDFVRYVERLGRGTKMPRLRTPDALAAPFPLPPLAEQHRIVAKVDELMDLCDRLETTQVEREARRDRLVSASLARVTEPDGADATSVTAPALFHLDNFARLTTRPEHVKELRQTILNLAVRGRLVETPVVYTPTSLGEVATLQNGYAFKSQWFLKAGIRLLRNTNVSHGTLCWDECVCLSQKQAEEFDRFRLSSGDIVLSLDRPFISSGTKVAWVRDSDVPCLLLQRVGRFLLNREAIDAKYLFLWVTSPNFKDQVAPGRSLGVPHIASKEVEAAVIDLPPLAEQRRIVAKVDELMALCDQLDASLASAATERARLLEALLHEALAPAA